MRRNLVWKTLAAALLPVTVLASSPALAADPYATLSSQLEAARQAAAALAQQIGNTVALQSTTSYSSSTSTSSLTSTSTSALVSNSSNQTNAAVLQNGGSSVSAPASSPVFARDLELGDVGEDVRTLQVFLNARGFTIAASGPGSSGQETTKFGYATQAALKRFQASAGISATGALGPITRSYIATSRNTIAGLSSQPSNPSFSTSAGSSSVSAADLAALKDQLTQQFRDLLSRQSDANMRSSGGASSNAVNAISTSLNSSITDLANSTSNSITNLSSSTTNALAALQNNGTLSNPTITGAGSAAFASLNAANSTIGTLTAGTTTLSNLTVGGNVAIGAKMPQLAPPNSLSVGGAINFGGKPGMQGAPLDPTPTGGWNFDTTGLAITGNVYFASQLPSGNLLYVAGRGAGTATGAAEVNPVTGQVVWSFHDAVHWASTYGPESIFKYSNGNYLIADVDAANRVYEITPGGVVVWEFTASYTSDAVPAVINGVDVVILFGYGDTSIHVIRRDNQQNVWNMGGWTYANSGGHRLIGGVNYLVVADYLAHNVKVVNYDTKTVTATIPISGVTGGGPYDAQWIDDDHILVAEGVNGVVSVWRVSDATRYWASPKLADNVISAKLSADGMHAIVGTGDAVIKLLPLTSTPQWTAGRVGIGTPNPVTRLHVEEPGASTAVMTMTASQHGASAQTGFVSYSENGDNNMTVGTNFSAGARGYVGLAPGGTVTVKAPQVGGVQDLSTGAKPACAAEYRGLIFVAKGAAGVADQPFVCAKKSDNSYVWVQLVTVP